MDDRHLNRARNLRLFWDHVLSSVGVLVNWLLAHAEGITLAVLVILPFVIVGLIVLADKNTPEAPQLDRFGLYPHDEKPIGKIKDISIDQEGNLHAVAELFDDFPAGAYIYVDPDTNHTELATAEDHNAIADGKGGYIK